MALEPTLANISERVRSWAPSEPLVRRIYLFGSRACGEERPDSDVDLAVLYWLPTKLVRECQGDRNDALPLTAAELAPGAKWTALQA